jgi:hypothetical protein
MMQTTIVKTYHGREQAAARAFQKDAADMAAKGYHPTSQQYVPGSYGCGSFILAALLCFIVIGIIVFIYMLLIKPPGVLTVTYEYRAPAIQQQAPAPPVIRYFLFTNAGVNGPYDLAALRAMWSAGQIDSSAVCCLEGTEEWQDCGTVLGKSGGAAS